MKVLQINSVCGIGSTGKIAVDLHNVLVEQGHSSMVAYGRGIHKGIDEKCTIPFGNSTDQRVHGVMTRLFDRQALHSVKATKKLIHEVKKYKPDVIHLHNIHGYYINMQILFNFLCSANIPVIWTLHDCWAFTGHCAYFDYIKCQKWKTQCEDCKQKKAYPASLIVDRSKKNHILKRKIFNSVPKMNIVTPSKWLAKLTEESLLSNHNIKVINNGIDTLTFRNRKSDFKEKMGIVDKKIVLGVANIWTEKKGFDDFIQLSKMMDDKYVIVLVGVSRQQISKLPKNIIGIQRTENQVQLAEIYSCSDIFVNTTYEDNFPTVNLEALACGTPVVTYNTGGSIEVINFDNGAIVKQGDINELKSAISKIISNGKLKNCTNLYSKDDKYSEYIELYNTAIANSIIE